MAPEGPPSTSMEAQPAAGSSFISTGLAKPSGAFPSAVHGQGPNIDSEISTESSVSQSGVIQHSGEGVASEPAFLVKANSIPPAPSGLAHLPELSLSHAPLQKPIASSPSPYTQQFSRFSSDTVQRILASAKKAPAMPPREHIALAPKPADQPVPKPNLRLGATQTLSIAAPMTLHMPRPIPQAADPLPNANSTLHAAIATPAIAAAPVALASKTPSAALSAIQKIIQGAASSRPPARKPSQGKVVSGESKAKKAKSVPKPKRPKNQSNDDQRDSELSSLSELSDDEPAQSTTATPTVTKSGRQVTKPITYNPAAAEPGVKKRQRAERSGRPPLCKRCTRWPSFERNKIVICDECLAPWHQRCHTPNILDEAVGDDAHWVCAGCRGDHPSKRLKTQLKDEANGANISASLGKPKPQSVVGTEEATAGDGVLPPELPHDGDTDSDVASQDSRAAPTKWPKGKRWYDEPPGDLGEYEPGLFSRAWPPWPAAGQGFYSMLPPEEEDEEHLVDYNDEALNHFVYSSNGTVIWRNGKTVDGKFKGGAMPEDDKKGSAKARMTGE